MDFKFGVVLFISANICGTLALPPCVCTRNLLPVCGSNGQTYSNECLLECDNYKLKSEITVAKQGSCDNSDLVVVLPDPIHPNECICPMLYDPVCGSDGHTYPNKCSFNCKKEKSQNLEVRYNGACQANAALEPPCTCPKIKKPVCGSDGATYSNDCLLNCATKNNSQLGIAHSGPCDDTVKVVN